MVRVVGKVTTGNASTVTVPVLVTVVGVFEGFNPLTMTVYTVVEVGETEIV